MYRVLVIDDNPYLNLFLEKGLSAQGFMTEVAVSGYEAITQALGNRFDLLIMELELPDKNGIQLIEELRGQGETVPIIILTVRNEIHYKVAGLESGADDYMTKPFRFEELLARVKLRIGRRSLDPKVSAKEEVLNVAGMSLNLHTRQIQIGGQIICLSSREFSLAEVFFRYPGRTFSREQLLDRVWEYQHNPGSNIVDVYVGYLRRKLNRNLIETVRGIGYRLQA
ncbi:MAG: response regulator transcription factor [Cyanobacteria bacterium P01_F01_bin.86]